MRVPAIAASAFASAIILVGVVALCVATAAALLAQLGWPFELFSHFRVQYFAGGALLAALSLALRQRAAATIAFAVAIVNSFNPEGSSPLGAAEAKAACDGPQVTVTTVNLRFDNRDHDRALAWLDAHPADVVVVQEVTAAWAATLSRLPGYPHRVVRPREDPYGLALLSKRPFDAVEWHELAGDGVPMVEAILRVRGQPVRLLGMHTRWPVLPGLLQIRDRDLQHAANRAATGGLPTIVAGDLNLSPDSPSFARLLRDGRLNDTSAGAGWSPTWLADFWPLALRIDHVLATSELCVIEREVGTDIGSDHRPVLVTVSLATPPASS